MYRWTCPHCSASGAGYASQKSAASSRNRHIANKHAPGGSALAENRKRRDARAKVDRRAHHTRCGAPLKGGNYYIRKTPASEADDTERPCPTSIWARNSRMGTAAKYVCFVLCPQRRHHMYEQARAHLVGSGFHISRIKRREGIDLQKHPDVRRDQVITMYVLEYLLPEMAKLFSRNPQLLHVFYVEDDCRLKPGNHLKEVLEAALAAGSKIGWLAYFIRNGEPRYGTHLVSFSRDSLVHVEELRKQFRASGLPAFDTLLYNLTKANPECIYVAPESIAAQTTHALAGRR